jgi:hypothetical protein
MSALSGRFRDKWRGYVLSLLASALRTIRMSGFMFSEMFGMLERLTALLATILVSRHGIPLTNPARRAGQMLPAMPGSVLAHSSAGNARVRVSPSAHRTLRRQRQHPVYRQVIARPSRQALAACCSSRRAAPDPLLPFKRAPPQPAASKAQRTARVASQGKCSAIPAVCGAVIMAMPQ